jgi:hypothetical protein
MRKINLDPYEAELETTEGLKKAPYDVRMSLSNLLFNPGLKLNSRDLLDNDRLSQKILGRESGSSILLEETEYKRLRSAIEGFNGFTKTDVELVRRVLDAPEVPVKEG